MLQSLRKETEGKLQMLLSPRKNGPASLFKEVPGFSRDWVFGEGVTSARGETAILGNPNHTRNMFGTSLHTTYCKQTLSLEAAGIMQYPESPHPPNLGGEDFSPPKVRGRNLQKTQ